MGDGLASVLKWSTAAQPALLTQTQMKWTGTALIMSWGGRYGLTVEKDRWQPFVAVSSVDQNESVWSRVYNQHKGMRAKGGNTKSKIGKFQ